MASGAGAFCPPAPWSSAIERASREQLEEIQSARLRELIRRTWERVPFYRRRWEAAGMAPEDVKDLGGLKLLPVISKKDLEEDLIENPPFGTYQGDFPAVRIQASSGTSGNPKPIFHTLSDWTVIGNFWSRRLHAQGVREGDIVQIVFTYSLFIAGFTATEGAMKLGALVVPAGSGAVTPSERQVRIAKDWGTTVLAGTPSYVLHLADISERAGLDLKRDFKLRLTCHTAEALSEPARRAIEERWGVEAFDNFGSVETGAPTFECAEKRGYHINEDGYIFEVLNPDTFEPLPAGREGVVAATSLFKQAAPVVRYNMEDISAMIDEPCPCGRTFRRLGKIRGRRSEMLKVRGVPLYPTAVEEVLERFPELAREYLMILNRVGAQDSAVVQVECRAGAERDSGLKERVERALKVVTGLSIEAQLLAGGELARSLKVEDRVKAKRILDRRGEGDVR
jgi:phenylacetate-CoA ligase